MRHDRSYAQGCSALTAILLYMSYFNAYLKITKDGIYVLFIRKDLWFTATGLSIYNYFKNRKEINHEEKFLHIKTVITINILFKI